MPRTYPAEFRARSVALLRASKPITTTAAELNISQSCLHNWIRQDQVNRGELPEITTAESSELRRARKRIRQLELEIDSLTKASPVPVGGEASPKRVHPVINRLVDAGLPPKVCCRVLGVSSPGYYGYYNRPLSRTQMRRQWLTGLILEVSVAFRGTYGSRPVHAELTPRNGSPG